MPSMAPNVLNRVPSIAALAVLESALATLRISNPTLPTLSTTFKRHASHASQGRANGPKNGPGKRLGAKKLAGEYVIPGNILYKQRGTLWFPGDNCYLGRDHTIHSGAPGYVKYYRDPIRHPKRKYIGIVFERDQTLPQPAHAVRRRKLGMLAYEMPEIVEEQETGDLSTFIAPGTSSSTPTIEIREEPRETRREAALKDRKDRVQEVKLTLRPGYQYRQANWEIGRAAERSGTAQSIRPFKPRDRFVAWQKSVQRKTRNAEKRSMGRGGKKKKK